LLSHIRLLRVALRAVTVALRLTFTVLTFLLFAARILLFLRFAQQAHVMLCVLLEILSGNTVVA
jgi:hypothetical protein